MTQPYDYHHPSQPGSSNRFSPGPWSPQSSHFTPASPPLFESRPQTVPPHSGPPVELPAGGTTGETNEFGHSSPYTETSSTMAEPKYDAQGNVWVPQVSMMQVPGQSPAGSPLYEGTLPPPAPSQLKYDPSHSRSRTPQELDTELRQAAQGGGTPTHQTYYHP
ncbi:hypothetical protein G7046_g9532 [Stylonectria norvegica]|nr:hypothetical protein G7046_g9532 [Stylonectria norvegica]